VTDVAGMARARLPVFYVVLACALFAALAGWTGYGLGQRSVGHDPAGEAEKRAVVADHDQRLELENKRLHARLGDLQSQLARQSDDLAFYRSIVSPADGIQGLRIQRFEVLPGVAPREVQLRLTLVQAMRHESIVAGLAQITLLGVEGGAPARHSVGDLLGKPRAELPFSFRYFQTIEQTVVLPEGFEPFETEVRVRSSKLRAPVQQTFAWKVAGQPVAAL
jgi:hypothetical protein